MYRASGICESLVGVIKKKKKIHKCFLDRPQTEKKEEEKKKYIQEKAIYDLKIFELI